MHPLRILRKFGSSGVESVQKKRRRQMPEPYPEVDETRLLAPHRGIEPPHRTESALALGLHKGAPEGASVPKSGESSDFAHGKSFAVLSRGSMGAGSSHTLRGERGLSRAAGLCKDLPQSAGRRSDSARAIPP